MRRTRLTAAIATAATSLLVGSGVALATGSPTPTAPPRIAFVANAFNPADALAVGPIAGQLGAPLFTTSASSLSDGAEMGLTTYAPELVLVAGGPGAVADVVLDEIRTATGLTGDAVDRVFGAGRTETAAALAQVFEERGIDPAFLPVGATATDADLLDGLDSTAFQPAGDYLEDGDAIDATTLGGLLPSEFAKDGDYAQANTACAIGQMVTGIDDDGTLVCAAPDGGDADTVDGIHAADLLPSSLDAFIPIARFSAWGLDGNELGTLDWRAPLTGVPNTSRQGTGLYTVDLPGITYGPHDYSTTCSVLDNDGSEIAFSSLSGNLKVYTFDSAGAAADRSFSCVVWAN